MFPLVSESKEMTSTGVVNTSAVRGLLFAYALRGGSTASSVIFADGDGGDVRWTGSMAAQSVAGDRTDYVRFDPPLLFPLGIHATLAGTGAVLEVAYADWL